MGGCCCTAIFPDQDPQSQGQYVPDGQMPQPTPIHSDFFKHLINSQDELLTFRLFLEGKAVILNPETEEEELVKSGEPMMNSIGIHDTLTFISSVCKRGTYVSNIDEDAMYNDMLFIADSFATMLFKGMVGQNKYGLRKENYDSVVEEFINFMEFSLRRPLNQGEREVFRGNRMQTEQTIRQLPLEEPRKKILGIF